MKKYKNMADEKTKEEKIREQLARYPELLEAKGYLAVGGSGEGESQEDSSRVKESLSAHFDSLLEGGLPPERKSFHLVVDLSRRDEAGETAHLQLLLEFGYDPLAVTVRPVSLQVNQEGERIYGMSLARGNLPPVETVLMLTEAALQLKNKKQFKSSPRKGPGL